MKSSVRFFRLVCSWIFLYISSPLFAQHKLVASFTITGRITGATDGTMVSLFDVEGQKVLDSVIITHESFVLKGHVDKPTTCWLRCGEEYAIIEVENTLMSFTSPLQHMKLNYSAEGGREQSLQNELDHLQRGYERIYTQAYDSLINQQYSDSIHKIQLINTFDAAQRKSMDIYVAFGRQHVNSYLGLDIVYRNRKRIPKDSVKILYNSLTPLLKSTNEAQALFVYATQQLANKGGHFVDFDAQTIQREPFKLSSLKGKYIYLTFGSFGCGPCRIENQEIAHKYRMLRKHLEIVNFSLDVNRRQWEAAAKLEGIIWHNISDLKGMTGKIKTLYDVQGMPTSFLIDPAGVIIERFDGYSDENIIKVERIVSNESASSSH